MPDLTYSFQMDEPPKVAQERFERELVGPIEARGFRVNTRAHGLVSFRPHLVWYLAVLIFLPSVVWRIAVGARYLTFEFEESDQGTTVSVSGRVSSALLGPLQALGRPGRWPSTMDDPDFLVADLPDRVNEQDSVPWGDENPEEMDRISRRALKRQRRTTNGADA